jgi:hypothetical protein
MWFLQLLGMLAFLFCVCYFFAAVGNNGFMGSRNHSENNLGCAIMMFIALLIYGAFKIGFGH